MRKVFLVIFIMLASSGVKAQEVFNYVLDNATRVVNTPTSSFTQTRIAQFKRTALVYLRSKAFEKSDSVSTQFLDTQAYYLSEFLTSFFREILKYNNKSDEAKRKTAIGVFIKASDANPLWNDPDEETTLSYVTSGEEITPFSLDTDWQKAFAASEVLLKEAYK